jgi:hypothetical protein
MSRIQAEPVEVAEASVYRRYSAAANPREAALSPLQRCLKPTGVHN